MQNTSGAHGAVHSLSILFGTVGDCQDDTCLHRSPYRLGNTKSRLREPLGHDGCGDPVKKLGRREIQAYLPQLALPLANIPTWRRCLLVP